jgi:hypothetical protein
MKDSYKQPYENIPDADIDYSEIVIPFSQLFNSYKPRDIYSGNERIPFKERKREFKTILRREFSKF